MAFALEVRKLRRAAAMLPESTIVAHASAYKPKCGVYFLVHRGRVVYVGQSENVEARLCEHWKGWSKEFDSWFWVPAPPGALKQLEADYIQYLDPPLNRSRPTMMCWDVELGAGRDAEAALEVLDEEGR